MENKVKTVVFCGIFFVALLGAVGCVNGEESGRGETHPVTSKINSEDFSGFHNRFAAAIEGNDWVALSQMTKFPFTFRGQLDFEGEIKVGKKEFLKIIPGFFDLEAFLEIDGEAFPTTYRVLAITPVDNAMTATGVKVDVHDFVFIKENDKWYFSQVYTDLSNVKIIKE